MPAMTGWEVVEAIRRRSPATPIVLITGLVTPEVMRQAKTQGLPVVPKPFDSEVLRAALANALKVNEGNDLTRTS
jgi:CheY-like chemotaxis protein